MAYDAHRLIPVGDSRGIEIRTVGTYPQASSSRVAPQAVGLAMAGDAALEILPGGLGMAQHPGGLTVVEGRHDLPTSLDAQVEVTLPAEGL